MCIRDSPVIRLLCQTELFRRLSHLLFVIVLELRQFFGVLFIRPWLDRRLVYIDDLVGWQRGEIFVWGCAVKDAEIQLPVSYTHLDVYKRQALK